MQSKILMSCLTAGVLIAGGLALRAADTNAPAATPPGASAAPPQQAAPPRVRPLPGRRPDPTDALTEEQRASYSKNIADKRAEMMEVAKLQADIAILRAKAFAEVQPPVTDEQMEKIKEMLTPATIRPIQPPAAAPPSATTNQSGAGVQPKQ